MLEANDLLLFSKVADEGSFSRAAARLGVPKSTVSRRVAALEATLGERLLLRTTRKLTVTDFGRAVLGHARHVAEDVEAAQALAANRQVEPSGRLRVTMPNDLASQLLSPMLASFALRYPRISLELDLTARYVDVVGENFDVALRVGPLASDATLAARRLATFRHGLYAAPAYLAKRGTPASPEELPMHDALTTLARSGEASRWTLTRGEQRWEGLPPPRAVVNSPEILTRLAIGGAGIVVAAHHFAAAHVERGELAPVLPEWETPAVDLSAVFPGRRLMPARTRVFVDELAAMFTSPACRAAERRTRPARRKAA